MGNGRFGGAGLGDAVGRQMTCHGEKWLKFALSVVGNRADAEDVLQEAARRVLARGGPFGSEDQVRMYLGRAIGNTAIEYYHSRKRAQRRLVPLSERVLAGMERPGPHEALEDLERWEQQTRLLSLVREGMAHLPSKQYEAIRRTVLDSAGVSIRDAGVESGIPYSTLRHRAVGGLKRLRRYLRRAGHIAGLGRVSG